MAQSHRQSCLAAPTLILLLAFSPSLSFLSVNVLGSGGRRTSLLQAASPLPIDPAGWPDRFPAGTHCSKCGLCETTFVSRVVDACAFLEEGMSRMDELESKVHGRGRDTASLVWSSGGTSETAETAEEGRFGVLHEPVRLARGVNMTGAQWTGVVTSIAVSMLETNQVDAVVCIAARESGWSHPEPILARTVEDVLRGRGVKPALAPSLRVLDEIRADKTIKRLLFCGVGCAVQAFRAVQDDLALDQVFVLGTNCVDNSPTPDAASRFVREGLGLGEAEAGKMLGYEFMQDFRVHIKTADDYTTKPYFSLPGTIAEQSIAKSCMACFDYTNGLADVVVGYMGGPPLSAGQRMDQSFQTLTVRNAMGAKMVETALSQGRLFVGEVAGGEGAHERLASATVTSDSLVQKMVGGKVQESGMPVWMGEILAFALRNTGPKGINFARYSIDYHLLRNYLYVVATCGEDEALNRVPEFSRQIIRRYLDSDDAMRSLKEKVARSSRVED